MRTPEEIFWFLNAEYDTIRDWVYKNEAIRQEHSHLDKAVKLPIVFIKFEDHYLGNFTESL